jgi:hypothetical protein
VGITCAGILYPSRWVSQARASGNDRTQPELSVGQLGLGRGTRAMDYTRPALLQAEGLFFPFRINGLVLHLCEVSSNARTFTFAARGNLFNRVMCSSQKRKNSLWEGLEKGMSICGRLSTFRKLLQFRIMWAEMRIYKTHPRRNKSAQM